MSTFTDYLIDKGMATTSHPLVLASLAQKYGDAKKQEGMATGMQLAAEMHKVLSHGDDVNLQDDGTWQVFSDDVEVQAGSGLEALLQYLVCYNANQ